MPTYLLRVEGVNLHSVVWDTDDLSTRRGGGLMLLDAFARLPEPPQTEHWKAVVTAASFGLFSFDLKAGHTAEEVQKAVAQWCRQGDLRHGTFVVDVEPAGGSGKAQHDAVQTVTARNRWRQMQEPSVSLDGLWGTDAEDACILDCVRPGVEEGNKPERGGAKFSRSVVVRRAYGQRMKRRFYDEQMKHLGGRWDDEFTREFSEIADADPLPKEIAPPTARDKLAVFYADGDGFGERGMDALRTGGLAKYGEWSKAIQTHHRELLRGLLQRADTAPGWKTSKGAIRLETLLWGGDEIIWVVPAWKGWELAEWFFTKCTPEEPTADGKPLTYSCGLVFCHVKAPIQNVVTLAKNVADLGKANVADLGKAAEGNRLAYEVLESFDDVTGDLREHRKKWLPENTDPNALLLRLPGDPAFWDALRAVARSDDFPMRQLYMRAHAWRKRETDAVARAEKRLGNCDAAEQLKTVLAGLGNSDVNWLHLLQMLPYIPTGGAA